MKHTYTLAAALLALGAVAAGCSGGGGSSSALPATGTGTPQQTQRGSAKFTITVPSSGTQSGSRTPRYISTNTKSVSIVETDTGAAALAPVVANVTPGSANCTTTADGTSCSIVVPANPGSDMFSVTTFDNTNATGNQLSTGAVTATIVAGQDNTTVPVVLGGVVNAVTVTLADAYAPVGSATSLAVVAKDASGATIVGTYDNAIALTAGSGVTLGASSVANSKDGAAVSVTPSGEQTAPVTITATGDGKSGTATLTPGSGIVFYNTAAYSLYDNIGFQMTTGTDGKLYTGSLGPTVCASGICSSNTGAIGRFDPATHTYTEAQMQSQIVGIVQMADGTIYAAESTAGKIAKFAPGTFPSAPVEVAVPAPAPVGTATPNPPGQPRGMTVGPDGNVWFTDQKYGKIDKIDVSQAFAGAAISTYGLPVPSASTNPTRFNPRPQGVVAGPDGNLYVADFNNGTIDQVSTAGATLNQYTLPEQRALDAAYPGQGYPAFPRFLATGTDGRIYITEGSQGVNWPLTGAAESMSTSGSFGAAVFPSAVVGYRPDSVAANNGMVMFSDLGNSAVGTYDIASGSLRELPVSDYFSFQLTGRGVNGVAFTPDHSPWFNCYGGTGSLSLCVGHIVLTSAWSVLPSRTVNIYGAGVANGQMMGIAESGNSGPFTITTSNSAIATAANISDHNFTVVGNAPGSATLTVTDAHARSVTLNVSVTTTTGSVQSRARNAGGIL